jgi:hypothetical protein
MAKNEEIGWDEAITTGAGFVQLETDKMKELFIKNWKFDRVEKFGKKDVEFLSECTEEDGQKVEKKFTTISNRLKSKLRPVLENKDASKGVRLSIIMVGEKFNTQYSVKETIQK